MSKKKQEIRKKKDFFVKKMPRPAIQFDRDKNESYLPQDEAFEPEEHIIIDDVPDLTDEDLFERGQNINPAGRK